MKIDYQIVVDQDGKPQSALLSWEDFQEIRNRLNIGVPVVTESIEPLQVPTAEEPVESEEEELEISDPPVEYREGGDYKPLKQLGVDLPKVLKRKVIPTDTPVIPQEEEVKEPEIKIGKRIR